MKQSATILLSLVLLSLFHSCTEKRFGFRKKYKVENRSASIPRKTTLEKSEPSITASSDESSPIIISTPKFQFPHYSSSKNFIHITDTVIKKDSIQVIKNEKKMTDPKPEAKKGKPWIVILFILFLAIGLSLRYSYFGFLLLGLIFLVLFIMSLMALYKAINKLTDAKPHKISTLEIIRIVAKFMILLGLLCILGILGLPSILFLLGSNWLMFPPSIIYLIFKIGLGMIIVGLISSFIVLEEKKTND